MGRDDPMVKESDCTESIAREVGHEAVVITASLLAALALDCAFNIMS